MHASSSSRALNARSWIGALCVGAGGHLAILPLLLPACADTLPYAMVQAAAAGQGRTASALVELCQMPPRIPSDAPSNNGLPAEVASAEAACAQMVRAIWMRCLEEQPPPPPPTPPTAVSVLPARTPDDETLAYLASAAAASGSSAVAARALGSGALGSGALASGVGVRAVGGAAPACETVAAEGESGRAGGAFVDDGAGIWGREGPAEVDTTEGAAVSEELFGADELEEEGEELAMDSPGASTSYELTSDLSAIQELIRLELEEGDDGDDDEEEEGGGGRLPDHAAA